MTRLSEVARGTKKGLLAASLAFAFAASPCSAHEGHDHDKPAPLNLPVAPRVIAVTPELELVGVVSGKERLTVFLHEFATNAPVKGAQLTLSSGANNVVAKPDGDGVFTASAPWLGVPGSIDLVFALKLADGSEDLLTGQLQYGAASEPTVRTAAGLSAAIGSTALMAGLIGFMLGGVLTVIGLKSRRTPARDVSGPDRAPVLNSIGSGPANRPSQVRAAAGAVLIALTLGQPLSQRAEAADLTAQPVIPSSMATDQTQRLPDGTIFLPKATQHLLSIRTQPVSRAAAARSTTLTGTIIAGPNNFGRVQTGRPGRIEAGPNGLAYVGKRVEKNDVLAYVETYIEAADRANMDSLIAETEARIEKNRTILSRYESRPGSVPQVKEDEVRGELAALIRKRAELVPSKAARMTVLAPISGVVSISNASIGQIVDGRDVLFEIVDPSQYWVEAHGYGHEGAALESLANAFAIVPDGRQLPLTFEGRGLALRQQATVLSFKIEGEQAGLAVGTPVKVLLQSSTAVDGFALPSAAIVKGNAGLPIVWIKTEPERFEPQTVKVEALDGRTVVVTAGLKEDQRVVTDGVTLLNQVR